LTTQARITRAALLSQLDGVGSKEGLLIIGTTNNAGDIDPSLVHRPSRFDRVWHFPLPDRELQRNYLAAVVTELGPDTVDDLSDRTADWSFAYFGVDLERVARLSDVK